MSYYHLITTHTYIIHISHNNSYIVKNNSYIAITYFESTKGIAFIRECFSASVNSLSTEENSEPMSLSLLSSSLTD